MRHVGGPPEAPLRIQRVLGAVGIVAAVLAALGLVAILGGQLLAFRDPFVPWREDLSVLLGTAWGTRWKAAVAGVALLGVGAATVARGFGVRNPAGWAPLAVAVLGLAFFPALTGHAAGVESALTVTVVADALHLLAAGVWLGTLGVILLVEAGIRRAHPDRSHLPSVIPAFSPVALGAFALLAATGAWASWQHLGGPANLFATGYGRLLLLKLVVVAGVAALGAWNWRRLLPRIEEPETPAKLRRSAGIEFALGQAVLVVTAILVGTSPG